MAGHGAHADPTDPFQKRVAITMAMYTVGLAFTNAMVNTARSRSIIKANDAAAKWSYFQSKSIKQQVKQLEISLVDRMGPSLAKSSVEKEKAEVVRYETEKSQIEREARDLETLQKRFEHQEHTLEYGAIAFELGIILAGVSLLQQSKRLFQLSSVCAAVAIGVLVVTLLKPH